ncbi:patched family protein [Dictyocaulus viviparus]|uniref:Patched family protein n=1 Tax=Dictyocaulus viviparus TaxID=29172 RepID=A0A0D8Y534_DICVI|nr:patched family protein [Dictyocaulus viviparus]
MRHTFITMRFDYIERRIAQFFYNYGNYVANNPMPFVVFPVLFTLAMATGFLHMQPLTDAVYLFTPVGALSKLERQAIHEKWPLSYDNYIAGRAVTQNREIQVITITRDDGNILEPPYSEAVNRLDAYIRNRIEILYDNHYYSYEDLCLQYKGDGCPANKHVRRLSDLYNHGFNITFPYFRLGTEGGYLGGALGGVSLMKADDGSNILASARAWFLIYHLKFYPTNISYISGLWEQELVRHLSAYPEDPYIKFTYFHSQTLADELRRNADSLMPRFVIAFTLLVVFSMLCSIAFIDKTCYIDWVLSKPILAILGVINAGMGIMTSIGMLLLFGMPYSDIVAVMPFLVVAVGTDNMFLMIAAMRRTSRCLPVSERMAECMSDAAVSILITASTDAFSFGVGAITSLPAVYIFCVYTGVAISFTFIYQVTFFASFLAIFTRFEEDGRNSISARKTLTESDVKVATLSQKLLNLGSKPNVAKGDIIKEAAVSGFFRDWYAPLLMNDVVRFIVMCWYMIYLFFAYTGVTQIKEGLEPINLLVEDSYAIPHYKLLQKYFWMYGATLQVVVNNAPDLRNATSRRRIHSMVEDFAETRHSMGKSAVQFWMYEMESYYHDSLQMEIVDDAFLSMLRHWLASKHSNPWAEDLYWDDDKQNGDAAVKSFRFLIGMRDISSTKQQMDATLLFREVAKRWSEYNVTSFMPLWLFTDQYAIIVPNTVQNIIIALACMVFIAFMLIPQPTCAFWVALACASIDFGVIGYMTLWEVNLDAISMITIIMSIGFSVDYSAHVTYGYVVSAAPTPRSKVQDALSALGWPLCQGALSTIIAVSVLADVPAYMIITFYKTVLLSILIGLLHGLIFLPVLLSTFVRGRCLVDSGLSNEVNKQKVTPAFKSSASLECGGRWTPNGDCGLVTPQLQIFQSPPENLTSSSQSSPRSVEFVLGIVHSRSRNSNKSPKYLE